MFQTERLINMGYGSLSFNQWKKILHIHEKFISNLIGSNTFSSWKLFAFILHYTGPLLYYTILDQTITLHYTGPDNYFTLYWTRQLLYIILDQTIILHYTGSDNYFTLYWTRQLLYTIVILYLHWYFLWI
jgi:hypothetical protein